MSVFLFKKLFNKSTYLTIILYIHILTLQHQVVNIVSKQIDIFLIIKICITADKFNSVVPGFMALNLNAAKLAFPFIDVLSTFLNPTITKFCIYISTAWYYCK